MFIDVCIPNNNEEKFIEIANRLGTKGLLFLYEKQEKDLSELQKKTKIILKTGLIIKGNTNKQGATFAKGEQQNIENRNIKFLFDFEEIEQKDSFHYRRSGVNQVLSKIMKEKNKILVFDMEKSIINQKQRDLFLGRMKQNLMLAQKYKLQTIICSFATKPENLRAEKEYSSIIRAFGYEQIAKEATNNLQIILNEIEQKD